MRIGMRALLFLDQPWAFWTLRAQLLKHILVKEIGRKLNYTPDVLDLVCVTPRFARGTRSPRLQFSFSCEVGPCLWFWGHSLISNRRK